jgi:hypothetical protein
MPTNPTPNTSLMDRTAIPHELLDELRTLCRVRPAALDDDLPQFALTRLHRSRNNRLFRWNSPLGPICIKLYRTDKRDRARCEWTALHHLAAHGITAIRQPLWHDPHPDLPAVGMSLIPGQPITTLNEPQVTLPALVTTLDQIRSIPLGPFANLGRLGSATDYFRRITIWSEHLSRQPDDPGTRDLISLHKRWLNSGDVAMLAQPAPPVLSSGDSNLDNWLWHSYTSALYVLDWEFAGYSDLAYDTAELIEHPSARILDDARWLTLLPDLGIDRTNDGRFAAARRTVVLRWLAVRWKRRRDDELEFDQQLHRAWALITAKGG